MTLIKDYPWIQTPFIANGPMRLIALAPLAVEVTKAGTLNPSETHDAPLTYGRRSRIHRLRQ
jgi:hypothetical protein